MYFLEPTPRILGEVRSLMFVRSSEMIDYGVVEKNEGMGNDANGYFVGRSRFANATSIMRG